MKWIGLTTMLIFLGCAGPWFEPRVCTRAIKSNPGDPIAALLAAELEQRALMKAARAEFSEHIAQISAEPENSDFDQEDAREFDAKTRRIEDAHHAAYGAAFELCKCRCRRGDKSARCAHTETPETCP